MAGDRCEYEFEKRCPLTGAVILSGVYDLDLTFIQDGDRKAITVDAVYTYGDDGLVNLADCDLAYAADLVAEVKAAAEVDEPFVDTVTHDWEPAVEAAEQRMDECREMELV